VAGAEGEEPRAYAERSGKLVSAGRSHGTRASLRPETGSRMADNEALRVSTSGSPPWLVIAGEIDESTYPILLAGLAAAEGYREIRIDLSGVRYCDLAGLHRIVGLTWPSSASGRPIRRVVLHAVPSWLAEILQILGWDTVPGIALDELPRRSDCRPADQRSRPDTVQRDYG
jgi:ABC-type transporter Mla MlaB component